MNRFKWRYLFLRLCGIDPRKNLDFLMYHKQVQILADFLVVFSFVSSDVVGSTNNKAGSGSRKTVAAS